MGSAFFRFPSDGGAASFLINTKPRALGQANKAYYELMSLRGGLPKTCCSVRIGIALAEFVSQELRHFSHMVQIGPADFSVQLECPKEICKVLCLQDDRFVFGAVDNCVADERDVEPGPI